MNLTTKIKAKISGFVLGNLRTSSLVFGSLQKSLNNRELLEVSQKLRDILNIVHWAFSGGSGGGQFCFFLEEKYCCSELFTVNVKMSKI